MTPSELAQRDIDEWEALSESERALMTRAVPEAADHPRLCHAYLRMLRHNEEILDYLMNTAAHPTTYTIILNWVGDRLRESLVEADG